MKCLRGRCPGVLDGIASTISLGIQSYTVLEGTTGPSKPTYITVSPSSPYMRRCDWIPIVLRSPGYGSNVLFQKDWSPIFSLKHLPCKAPFCFGRVDLGDLWAFIGMGRVPIDLLEEENQMNSDSDDQSGGQGVSRCKYTPLSPPNTYEFHAWGCVGDLISSISAFTGLAQNAQHRIISLPEHLERVLLFFPKHCVHTI